MANMVYIDAANEYRQVSHAFFKCLSFIQSFAHTVDSTGGYHHPAAPVEISETTENATPTALTEGAIALLNSNTTKSSTKEDDSISVGSSDRDSIFDKNSDSDSDFDDDSDNESVDEEPFEFRLLVDEVEEESEEEETVEEPENDERIVEIVERVADLFETFG